MNKKIFLIIGIIIFILICTAYMKKTTKDNKTTNKNNKNIEKVTMVSDIVYRGKFPIPVENFIVVTSGYGLREGNEIVSSNHRGIDLCGTIGSRIIAVKDGEITYAGWQSGYGNCVEIKHIDENGKVFYTFYAHMRDNSLQVKQGQKVMTGQVIGTQGTTGNSTGDHLHFEIRTNSGWNGYAIDPTPYLFEKV